MNSKHFVHSIRIIVIISLLVAFILQTGLTQAQQKDAGMWTTFSLEKKLPGKFSLTLDEELRLKENFSRLNLFYTNLGVVYKFHRNLRIGLTYRLTEKYLDNKSFSFRHRLMLDFHYRYKYKTFSVSYRGRIQSEVRNYFTSELGKIPEWLWRSRLEIKYMYQRYVPYIGTEPAYTLKDPRNPEYGTGIHSLRIYGGLDYKITKRNTIGVYYLMQKDIRISYPETSFILGLQYTVELND